VIITLFAYLANASFVNPQNLLLKHKNSWLSSARTLVRSTAAVAIASKSANAKTYFDTDVYGDKELKIATVNKMKQKLRNAILSNIAVAPYLLKLSINDALGFDVVSSEGG
jgi:hypothetical protein